MLQNMPINKKVNENDAEEDIEPDDSLFMGKDDMFDNDDLFSDDLFGDE